MRDLEAQPYSDDEKRVASYFMEISDIGGGDDPVGALMAQHAYLNQALRDAELALRVWDDGRNSEYWLRYPDRSAALG